MKIKRILAIFVLSLTICLSGFIFAQNKVETVYADTLYNSYYLLDESVLTTEEKPFKSNIVAGQTSGYTSATKEYQLGDIVQLSTTANAGFKVVGWRVEYEKNGQNIVKYLIESGTIEDVNYIITYSGNNNLSSFELASAFADMTIEPVFDYVHYNLNVTNFNELLNLGTEVSIGETIVDDTVGKEKKYNDSFYYKTLDQENGITTYSNVILKRVYTYIEDEEENIDTQFYYFDELKTEGNGFYTIKQVEVYGGSSTKELKTNYTLGCYELGDQVNPSFDVAFDEMNLKTSKNINLNSVTFNGNVLNKVTGAILYNNSYNEVRNNYNLTTSFACKITIVDGDNSLAINKEDLYLVNILSFVDDEDIDSLTLILGDRELIEESFDVVSYQKINNTRYLAGRSGIKFTAKDVGVINPATNEQSIYYTFEKLEYENSELVTSNNTEFSLSELNKNLDVKVYFKPYTYTIDFKFAVKENDAISERTGNVLSPITSVERNHILNRYTYLETNKTFEDKIGELVNVGYKFYGLADNELSYVKKLNDIDNPANSFSYIVDGTYPSNATFYLVFEKIEYALELKNTTEISLNNSSISANPTTFYPINSISFVSGDVLSNTNGIDTDLVFATKLKLGDRINFSYNATNGFVINGIKFVNGSDETAVSNSFLIDEEFIASYANDGKFTINAEVDFIRYTLTYITSLGTIDNTDTVIAHIEVSGTDAANILKYESVNSTIADENLLNPYKIIVNNLKLYDTVQLNHNSLNENYRFVNFKSGNFTLSTTDEPYSFVVNRADINTYTVNVKYSNITNAVTISSNIDSAISLDHVKVLQEGIEIDIDSESVNKGSEVTIRINIESFESGYNFVSYTIKNFNVADLTLTTIEDFEETINEVKYKYKQIRFTPNQDGSYEIQLNFEYIEYQYEVYTRIEDGEISQSPLISGILTVENNNTRTIRFEKLLGYYVSEFRYGLNLNNLVLLEKNQTNNDKFAGNENFSYFTYLFEDEMNSLMNIYSSSPIIFVATYSVFTYTIDLNVTLNGGEFLSNINKPTLKLTYLDNADNQIGEAVVLNEELETQFSNISYASKVKIEVLDVKKGLKFSAWKVDGAVSYTRETEFDGVNFGINNSLIILNQIKDYVFTLDLTYQTYSISIKYNEIDNEIDTITGDRTQGKVSVVSVENVQENITNTDVSSRFNLFNNLTFKLVPNETRGYTYNGVYLKIDKTKNTFETNKYFEVVENKFVLTDDMVFDQNKDYYISLPIMNFIASINNLDVEKFEIENILNVYVEFEFFKFNVLNSTLGSTIANFGGNDVLTYSVSAKQIDGENWVELAEQDYVDISYKIRVEIQLGQYKEMDLYRGAIINYIQIGSNAVLNNNNNGNKFSYFNVQEDVYENEAYKLLYLGEGKYVLYLDMSGKTRDINNIEFNMISCVNIENKVLNLNFGLLKRNGVSVIVTTSIPSTATTFYNSTQIAIKFGQRTISTSTKQTDKHFIERNNSFLDEELISFYFQESGYDQNFKITGLTFKIGGETITYRDESDLIECKAFGMNGLVGGRLNQFNLLVVDDVQVIFEIEPIIKIRINNQDVEYKSNTDYKLTKTFDCDILGAGVSQSVNSDIITDDGIKSVMIVKHYLDTNKLAEVELKNVGLYHVVVTFGLDGEFGTMLEGVEINFDVEILPLQITLESSAPESFKLAKEYNASDNYSSNVLLQYIKITADGSLLNVNYLKNSNQTFDSNFVLSVPTFAKIRENNSDISATSASEQGQYYDLKLYGVTLKDGYDFNKNFVLINSELTFAEIVNITKREISVYNLGAENILDKVYDGNNVAYIKDPSIVTFQKNNVLNNDDVTINTDKIKLTFETFDKPGVSRVKVDLTGTVEGASARNYTVKETVFYVEGKTIYPQKLSINIVDFGTVSIENIDVLSDPTNENLISLISLNSSLIVDTIYSESNDFVELYQNSDLSDYLSNRKVFAVGFNIYLVDFKTGTRVPINNKLYIRLPNVEKLTQVLNIYNNTASNLYYTVDEDGSVLVKLEQIGDDLHYLIMIEDRPVVKLWQILLISAAGIAAVGTGVGLFIFFRKRKMKLYSLQEKI